jgi:nucleotide-binding universal stress UspA family protein
VSQSRRIVVPVDFSEHSRVAAARACELARASSHGVHLVHAVRPPVVMAQEFAFPSDFWRVLRESARKEIDSLVEALDTKGLVVTTELIEMEAVGTICEASSADDVDLIVMGTHGYTGWKHAFLGSVTERTLRSVGKPVLAVKQDEGEARRRPDAKILISTDFSSHSDIATAVACEWAEHLGAEIELLHVVPEPASLLSAYSLPGAAELLGGMRDAATAQLGVVQERIEAQGATVSSRLLYGDAPTKVADRAREIGAQLIAVGTRGNSGLKHVLLGSVAERILRLAPCAVLVASDPAADESSDSD